MMFISLDFHQTWYMSDIVEIWFGIANGQISSVFDRVICQPHDSSSVLLFHIFYFTPIQIYRKFHLQKLKIFR